MAIQAWLIPDNIVSAAAQLVSESGATFLNPVQDSTGRWFVSTEEMDDPGFEKYKTIYADVISQFELTDFVPHEIEIPE